VAGDSPGYSWDAGGGLSSQFFSGQAPPQGKAGENGQPGGLLCKSSLQETVGYAGGKLPAGVANDWVTRRSPSSASYYVGGEQTAVPPPGLRVTWHICPPSERFKGICCGLQNGGSMYSLACRTLGIIPREYCSLHDHGT